MSKRESVISCVRSSFAEGMGRILDFGNTLSRLEDLGTAARYKSAARGRRSPAAVDREAIASDWAAVGQDLRTAVRVARRSQPDDKTVKIGQRGASGRSRVIETVESGARTR